MKSRQRSTSRQRLLMNLNPVFHKRDKSEDNDELSNEMVKEAKKTGTLNLSSRGLANVPDKVWDINEPAKKVEVNLENISDKDDDVWWNQKMLTNLDLSSNSLTSVSPKIANLFDLTALNLYNNTITNLPKEIGTLENLTRINLSRNKLTNLPDEFFQLPELRHLNLSHNCFTGELHQNITDFHMLETLDVSNNNLSSLPSGIGFLVRLTEFLCSYNHLKELPADFVNLRSLQKLDLVHNDLEALPADIGSMRKLQLLYAHHNDINHLPNFDGCTDLQELHIANNFIEEIPDEFCSKLPHLKILDLRDNKIVKLPDDIALLQSLIRLDLSNNTIGSLPSSLHTLAHLVSLQIEGNPIKSIRRDIIQCGTSRILKTLRDRAEMKATKNKGNGKNRRKGAIDESVQDGPFPDKYQLRKTRCLSVTSQNFADIPENLFIEAREEGIGLIDFSKNQLDRFPDGLKHLYDCATEIVLSKNLIKAIPPTISQFNYLNRLDLSCNSLDDLPKELAVLNSLRELNIANNKFRHIPACIYNLSSLEVLLARENQIEQIDASPQGLGALQRLATLDLRNNNIEYVPPILGKLENITTLDIIGNRFRQPRHQILEKGTDFVMAYLRDRIPV